MSTWKTVLQILVIVPVAYLLFGYTLDRVIFREKIPEIKENFHPGDEFHSESEGFTQRIIRRENGMVFCELTIHPHAPDPPKHIHTGFDEVIETDEDGVFVIAEDDTLFIEPFQKYVIKQGIPHKPFNPTYKTIRITMKEWGFPENFAFGLAQMYGFMDQKSLDQRPVSDILLQLSLFSRYFDSYSVEFGPPVLLQKALFFFIRPVARLKGYRS